MTRHAREQVVDSLELQTAMDKVQPRRTIDVHGSTQLALRERFVFAKVRGRHAPVRQGDLDMQRHGDDVRDENKQHAGGPVRQRAQQQAIAKEEPVASHEDNFRRTNPPGLAAAESRGSEEDVDPREEVQVEAGDAHDGVVGVLLVGNEDFGGAVPDKSKVVVGGAKGLEKGRAGGEERNVLDIRVVLLEVGVSE